MSRWCRVIGGGGFLVASLLLPGGFLILAWALYRKLIDRSRRA